MDLPHGDEHAAEARGICWACQLDLARLSSSARFCPRCGGELVPTAALAPVVPADDASPLEPEYWSLRAEIEANLADQAAGKGADPAAGSMIMLAYANAMLNLGWRYANAQGARRDQAEAGRCYKKAGRLSAAWGRR